MINQFIHAVADASRALRPGRFRFTTDQTKLGGVL